MLANPAPSMDTSRRLPPEDSVVHRAVRDSDLSEFESLPSISRHLPLTFESRLTPSELGLSRVAKYESHRLGLLP
jgi:hypothetical protein